MIKRLTEQGITAVIGPKAPWISHDGRLLPNPKENGVGVYIVSKPVKSEDDSSNLKNNVR